MPGYKKKYSIIYADPPWWYSGPMNFLRTGKVWGTKHEFTEIRDKQLLLLNVQDFCNDNCVLYLWTTNTKLSFACDLIKAWGFTYSSVAFVWHKPIPIPGHYTIGSCEYVLVAKNKKSVKVWKKNERQFFEEPKKGHIMKPDRVRESICDIHPQIKNKLELFGREKAPGWDVLGNECKDADYCLIQKNGTLFIRKT